MRTRLSDRDLDQRYRDFLDEVHGTVTIAGLEYATSRALLECDPTAYRCGFNDWLDAEYEAEVIHEINGEYFDGPKQDECEA